MNMLEELKKLQGFKDFNKLNNEFCEKKDKDNYDKRTDKLALIYLTIMKEKIKNDYD